MMKPVGWFFGSALRVSLGVIIGAAGAHLMTSARAQGPGGAGAFHPNSSYAAESLLRNASRHVADKQWPEAIDLYLRVIERHGDAVALAPGAGAAGSLHYVNARRHAQATLAALPPEGLAEYRRRVDARVEQQLRQAELESDRSALRRIVSESFASRWGDQALELLGDLEFRAGRFQDALRAYHQILPDPLSPPGLVYPDPDVDLAKLSAKILLCRAAAGNTPTTNEIEGYRKANPGVQGTFAGRQGALGDSLSSAVADDRWVPYSDGLRGWPTLAGAFSRNRVLSEKIDVGSLQWKIDIPIAEPVRGAPEPDEFGRFGGGLPRPSVPDGEPATFPVIADGVVMIAGESRVEAFRLDSVPSSSGDAEVRKEARIWESPYTPPFSASQASRGWSGQAVPRFALTVVDDRVYARLGATGRGTNGGVLFAIQSNAEVEGKLIWRKQASDIDVRAEPGREHHGASFEGAPVADQERVFIALTETAQDTWAYVACLDAETGATIWVTHLGSCAPRFDPSRNLPISPSVGNRMLSLEGDRLYYQMNMGAVASLDTETGAVYWVSTYPTTDRSSQSGAKRSPNPALVADGLVIVAPEDAPGLYAFEAESGRLAWQTAPVPDLQHLLGVSKGKLFATGTRLYTFEAKSGNLLRTWPDAGGRFDGYGRGVLANGFVYWPTRTEILVVDQASGGDAHASIPLFQSFGYGGGNLAVGDGYLVVAQRERLVVYCQSRRLLERVREQLARSPGSAVDHFEYARLAEAAGDLGGALDGLEAAARFSKAGDVFEGQPLRELARAKRHELLVRWGDELQAKGDLRGAVERYRLAAEGDASERNRLTVLAKLATALESQDDATPAIEALQTILGDDRLGRLIVPADDRRQIRAELWALERLVALVNARGPGVYAPFDREATLALERARRAGDPAQLAEVARRYPMAQAAAVARRELADLALGRGDAAAAISIQRRMASLAPDESQRAAALLALGDLYDASGRPLDARRALERAAARYGRARLESGGRLEKVEALAARRLEALAARSSLSETGAAQSFAAPRIVSRYWGLDARPFWLGADQGDDWPLILASESSRLELWEIARGEPIWSGDLGIEPEWAGLHGDLLLIASATRIYAVNRRDGGVAWRFDSADPTDQKKRVSPFSRFDPNLVPIDSNDARSTDVTLHGFQLVDGRLSALRGDRGIVVLDAVSGELQWMFTARADQAGGTTPSINSHWLVTPEFLVVETGPPHQLWVLSGATGATIARLERGADSFPIVGNPVTIDADRVLLPIDPRTVAILDARSGTLNWTYRNSSALPRMQAPIILSRDGILLALFGGHELVRLGLDVGAPLWTRTVGPTDLSGAPDALTFDEQRVYCVWRKRCDAFRLTDGEPAWHQIIAGAEPAPRAVALLGPWLVLYPSGTRLPETGVTELALSIRSRETGAAVQDYVISDRATLLGTSAGETGIFLATQRGAHALARARPEEP